MAITGNEKEKKGSYSKFVGMFNASVVAVNPTKEELSKLLNFTVEKDPEYTGSNDETGAKKVTVSFWLEEEKTKNLFNVRFGLEDTVVESKTGKTQYINSIGDTSYAEDKSKLPGFFTENGREVRPAKKGEELLYKFLRAWLHDLNYEDPTTELTLEDWKGLMSGKTKELREAINKFSSKSICALATVRTGSDGKEYQGVYSYGFLPSFALSCFSGGKVYKSVDKFIEKVTDAEYGCKDFYELKPLKEYDPANNVVASSNSAVLRSAPASQTAVASEVHDDLPF